MNLNWYVLYTKPHSESQVEAALTSEGIEAYLPTLPVAAPRRGRSTVRPFFPCYLFAHLDLAEVGISHLNWTRGMRHLVMFGDVPARVDETVIARIRSHLEQNHPLDRQGEILYPGDRVRLIDGPLQDFEAIFNKRLSAAGRVQVLIHWLQRWTPVDVEATAVRKVSPFGHPRAAA